MFHQPKTIKEALEIKAEYRGDAAYIAGGTDVMAGASKGKSLASHVIDLSHVESLCEMATQEGCLKIGSMVTHRRLEDSSILALAQACRTVGGPQIRNLGTIGGQLGTASPAGDVSVALIALDAEVSLANSESLRRLPLRDFFVSPGRTVITDDEMILAVYVPLNRRSAFLKLGKRDAVAISLVMAAASVTSEGVVSLGLGSVAPIPLRCDSAEAYLKANGLRSEAVDGAVTCVQQDVSPIDDHRGGADYRRAMSGVLAKRLLHQLL